MYRCTRPQLAPPPPCPGLHRLQATAVVRCTESSCTSPATPPGATIGVQEPPSRLYVQWAQQLLASNSPCSSQLLSLPCNLAVFFTSLFSVFCSLKYFIRKRNIRIGNKFDCVEGVRVGPNREYSMVRGVACIPDVGCAHPEFAPYLSRIGCPKVRCVHPSKWPFWLRASLPKKTLACIRFRNDPCEDP